MQRWSGGFAVCVGLSLLHCTTPGVGDPRRALARPADAGAVALELASGAGPFSLSNRFAYIPPQCYAKIRDAAGRAKNPCFACHVHSEPPNFVDDADLQLRWSLPPAAAKNPWTNVLDPPVAHAPRLPAQDILEYVRGNNYLDDDGRTLTLGRTIASWEANGESGRRREWRGFWPDAWFSFDDRGFDHRPDGALTGWRAFGYYPFLGAFLPTNGSMDDVLIRLDPILEQDDDGRFDQRVYEVNLAIVEALVTRADVPIDAADEASLGVDLDLDGKLGRATRVAFDGTHKSGGRTRMQYVGRARAELLAGRFPISPGLFPLRTEFLHSVRYLDVDHDGTVKMAARMKELRYAKKVRWYSYDELKSRADLENEEQSRAVDRVVHYAWQYDRGVHNGQGWLFQGFIEAADGTLRPQSYEESVPCAGCHGGIGATTDSIFSLPRKLGAAFPAHGWFHWTQHDLRGVSEPRTRDGHYEYTQYLAANGAADDFRENTEAMDRFFDARGSLRPSELARLHQDVTSLLLPSAERALDLDRAYEAIVRAQNFTRGRDAVLGPSANAYTDAPVGERTGIDRALQGR